MKKFVFLTFFVLACSCFVNAATIVSISDPVQQAYSTISTRDLSKMSVHEFENYIGRKLNAGEKVQFKQEKRQARMKMKKDIFGRDGGFPWWSLILAVLVITVTLIAVL
jgi:hypothetical protein